MPFKLIDLVKHNCLIVGNRVSIFFSMHNGGSMERLKNSAIVATSTPRSGKQARLLVLLMGIDFR